ncbi:hypothetical protein AVEN_244128-1 [Araneus ventricosus]|uniref:Uncharacterized protein n=1 Tax=Araneus ventricosus TaxID=182803 RepID=A0A4Y2T1T3_ARAVE|nr:hypothetical protein AVEN_244128-1 [Araneus ventricosus]
MIWRKKHWTILCTETSNSTKINITQNPTIDENIALSNQSQLEVLLQTLVVITEAGGKTKTVRALLDTGSQRSYLLKSTINQMKATAKQSENLTHIVFGGISSKKQHNCYKHSVSNLKKTYSCKMQVLDQQVICGYIPSIQEGPWIEELWNKGNEFTDVVKSSQPIELLIGTDYAGNFFTENVLHLSSGLVAVETYLGWSIMGKPNPDFNRKFSSSLLVKSVKEESCEGPGHYLSHRRVSKSYPTVGVPDLDKIENIYVKKPWKHVQLKTSSNEVIRPIKRIYPLDIRYAGEDCPSSERTLTTKSGRTVKVPSRFMST